MKLKKKKKRVQELDIDSSKSRNEIAWQYLCNMKHKDLQKACISRGMDFKEVIEKSHPQLVLWFYENFDRTQDINLLTEFDEWMDNQVQKLSPEGFSFRNPLLRFNYVEPIINGISQASSIPKAIENAPEKTKKEKIPSVVKTKHPEWDIMTGTKKFMVYELTITKKMELEEIIPLVRDKYSEVEEKSIKIWFKRAIKFL